MKIPYYQKSLKLITCVFMLLVLNNLSFAKESFKEYLSERKISTLFIRDFNNEKWDYATILDIYHPLDFDHPLFGKACIPVSIDIGSNNKNFLYGVSIDITRFIFGYDDGDSITDWINGGFFTYFDENMSHYYGAKIGIEFEFYRWMD